VTFVVLAVIPDLDSSSRSRGGSSPMRMTGFSHGR